MRAEIRLFGTTDTFPGQLDSWLLPAVRPDAPHLFPGGVAGLHRQTLGEAVQGRPRPPRAHPKPVNMLGVLVRLMQSKRQVVAHHLQAHRQHVSSRGGHRRRRLQVGDPPATNRAASDPSHLLLQICLTGQPFPPLILAGKVAYSLTDTDSSRQQRFGQVFGKAKPSQRAGREREQFRRGGKRSAAHRQQTGLQHEKPGRNGQ